MAHSGIEGHLDREADKKSRFAFLPKFMQILLSLGNMGTSKERFYTLDKSEKIAETASEACLVGW